MKLSKQVTSLQLSKRLKELGVKQDSLFYYANHFDGDREEYVIFYEDKLEKYTNNCGENEYYDEIFSAFTVAELGEMLPEISQYRLNITKQFDKNWDIEYRANCYDAKYGELLFALQCNTEADARAKMLIYLLENKLINI